MRGHNLAVAGAIAGAGALLTMGLGAGTHAHAAGPVSHYVFSPNPIATSGTLGAGATVPVTVTAEDSTNTPVPAASVFLYITSVGGTATANSTSLTSTPQAFVADGSGNIAISYTTAATPPASGIDKITAKNAASGATITAHIEYSYSGVHKYAMQPKPIGVTATLAGGTVVTINLTAVGTTGSAVSKAKVYLSFVPTTGGGIATCLGHKLSATPKVFTTNTLGQLKIVYTVPAAPPASGTDTVTANNAASHSTVSSTDTYTF